MKRTELYNLNTDWSEQKDVAAENPEKVDILLKKLEAFQESLPKDPPAGTFSEERKTFE